MPATMPTIRPLSAADEPVLWVMLYLALYVPPGAQPFPLNIIFAPKLARYVRGWGGPHDLGFAAWEAAGLPLGDAELPLGAAELPLGAAWLRLLAGESRGYGWVSDEIPELSVAVMPERRGQGLGTQLIQRVLDAAAGHYPGVSLSVSAGNPAEALYRRLEFETVQQSGDSLTMLRRF